LERALSSLEILGRKSSEKKANLGCTLVVRKDFFSTFFSRKKVRTKRKSFLPPDERERERGSSVVVVVVVVVVVYRHAI
jgi:hypothetical protein